MTIKSRIYQELRKEIVFGTLMPGERITETRLAEKFSCSRGPIREALSRLEREGFIELTPNQGAVVTKISPQEVRDYYSLLQVLEGKAVQWSTSVLTAADIHRLAEINESMKKIERDDKTCVEDWISRNYSFHRIFREKCGNEKMDWVVEEIRLRISRYLFTSLMVTAFDLYIEDHDLIIDAVRRGDAEGAGLAMENHILHAKDVVQQFFSRMPSF